MMEVVEMRKPNIENGMGHSCKGNQLKWEQGGWWYKAALVLKTVASVVFILSGFYCMGNCSDSNPAWFVVAGLIMGGIGDFFLNLQFIVKEKWAQLMFIVGALAFLTGHVFYFMSLLPYVKDILLICFLITAVITGVTLAWVYSRNVIAFGLKIFGVFYIGAALFTASDVILIFNMFGEKKLWMRSTNLILYYLAQLVIASSLLFVM